MATTTPKKNIKVSKKTSSKKSVVIKKKKIVSKIISHNSTGFQKLWPWSPKDGKIVNSKLPTLMKIKDIQISKGKSKTNISENEYPERNIFSNKIIEITGAKSDATLEKSTAFLAVISENYRYNLDWSPITIFEPATDSHFIIGMVSEQFHIQKQIPTILEWHESLTNISRLEDIEILDTKDINIITGSMKIAVYDPKLLQAIDCEIGRLKKIENKFYLDTLFPIFMDNSDFDDSMTEE